MDITGEKNSKTALSYLESSNMDEQVNKIEIIFKIY